MFARLVSTHVQHSLVLVLAIPVLAAAQDPAAQPPPSTAPRVMRISLPPVGTAGDSARVHCRTIDGAMAVPAVVNGAGPYWFVLDTGAPGHGRISDSLAVKLGFVATGKARSGDPSGKNVQEVNLYSVDSLQIGSVTLRGATMSGGRRCAIGPASTASSGSICSRTSCWRSTRRAPRSG